MSIWNTSHTWQIMALLTTLLTLSSCASTSPTIHTTETPTFGDFPTTVATAGPTPSPYKPTSQAAQAIRECAPSAFNGGCYTAEQIQTFYDLNPLYAKGYNGKGSTIIILDPFGSPTIKHDLQVFDQVFGLPDPPSFAVDYPLGPVVYNSGDANYVGAARETTLDVEWAHAIAPGANMVLLISNVNQTNGVQGLPEIEQLSVYAMDNHLGQVISMSFGASEPTLVGDPCNENLGNGQDLLKSYDQNVFQRALTEHVTILDASGDAGATNYTCSGGFYSYRNVAWPSSDPLETTVGGTKLSLKDAAGAYGSERVWNENGGAGGGGISQFYAEPDWQKNLPNQSELKGKRGIPDVALGAAVNYAFYHSYGGDVTGWSATGGTSIGSPQWAGLVAIADQMAGKPLGFLNPALYNLAGKGFHDVTKGDNSLAGVQGYAATPGWDLATGWGTPDAAVLLPLLITAVQQTS